MTSTFGMPTSGSGADSDQAMRAINDACRRKGGVYSTYSCKAVSWDDSARGVGFGGGLSTVGPNITDTYLKAKDGTRLYTVRSDNWNEKLGSASAAGVAVVAGNHAPEVVGSSPPLAPLTLGDLLKNIGTYGGYAGLKASTLDASDLDAQCSIRFQTTFLPASAAFGGAVPAGREAIEFATEAYNYQTRSDDDPKNLVLLCTTQGVAVQADGASATRLYHHRVDGSGAVHRHWLEAERSQHKVGGAQNESAAEKADALARGKATASVIGPECVGTRFNVLMTIQVPLKQQAPAASGAPFGGGGGGGGFGGGFGGAPPPPAMFGGGDCFGGFGAPAACAFGAAPPPPVAACAFGAAAAGFSMSRSRCAPPATGVSNAARVSRGSEHDVWRGLSGHAATPSRHESQRITITVVLYNTCVGGVPSESDVVAAIDDLEALYAACRADRRAEQPQFNSTPGGLFPPPPITTTPPPPPPPKPAAVTNASTFPSPQTLAMPIKPAAPLPGSAAVFVPFGDLPQGADVSGLPRTEDGYNYVSNLGLARLAPSDASRHQLADAFALYRLANDMHAQIHGSPSSRDLYNLACCCSRLAALPPAQPQGGAFGASPFASLSPSGGGGAAALSTEQCLNAGIAWLRAAAAAGWSDSDHMQKDDDLAALRAQRPTFFATAVKMSEAMKAGI